MRALRVALGTSRSACEGIEREIKVDRTASITKEYQFDNHTCRYQVDWQGPLFDLAELKKQIPAPPVTVKRAELKFEDIKLIDEFGSAITNVNINALKVKLMLGEQDLTTIQKQDQKKMVLNRVNSSLNSSQRSLLFQLWF